MKAAKWTGGLGIVGLIGAAVVTQLLGLWHWGGAQEPNVPLKISITSPTQYVSPVGNVFSGTIQGLQPGQTIWIFSKQMTNRNGPITSGVVTMNEGPCDVSGGTWTCPNVGIGGSHPQDNGSYQVWAAVIDPSDVRQLENALVNHGSVVSSDEPPHTGQGGGIYSENVTR